MLTRHASALSLAALVVASLLGTASMSRSEMANERTAVRTASGVITDINIDSRLIVLKGDDSDTPVTYTFSKETVFMNGKGGGGSGGADPYEAFKNSRVTIQYTVEGDRMIVNRVAKEDKQ